MTASAQDKVYSGPQAGEKTTPFRVVELAGAGAGKELDLMAADSEAPVALVFIHGVERSMAPLLRVIDQYGAERKDLIKTEFVFLSGDRVGAEQRFPAVGNSLKLQSHLTLSLDGPEGPGNYGLNKECLLTVVLAKRNKVTANFALVQPGMADAPKIIQAMAETAGDSHPPDVAALVDRRQALNGGKARPKQANDGSTAAKPAPGAAPTDEKLVGLLRQFIRPTNDDSTVDKVMAQVEDYIKGNRELTKQAIDGWTRVLYYGDRYGTAYSRKVGQAFIDRLKQ